MIHKSFELTVVAVLVASAFFIGRNWRGRGPEWTNSSLTEAQQQLANIRDQMQILYETDLQEYSRLKTMEAKYRSANNILAKMMTIFLADLGLRISENNIQQITSPLPTEASDDQASNKEICRDSTKPLKCPSLAQMARQQGKQIVDPKAVKKEAPPTWVENEDKLANVQSEDDAKEFLKAVEIENFFNEIAASRNVGKIGYEKFQGVFEGTLYYDDPETAPAEVFMQLDGAIKEDGNVEGRNEVKLSREGKAFSHSTGNGDIKNYKKTTSSEKTLFVDLGGKMGFLQVYFLDGGNTLIGNFYRQQDVAKFSKEGIVRLYRR